MPEILDFPELLRLIDERSDAFRATIAAAPSLDVVVPTCPEWTLFDLAEHIGTGRRSWAATVAAGPAETKADLPPDTPEAPRDDREALLTWLADSTQELVDALRKAGPDSTCWNWWADSQSPPTTGAVARHQLQQFVVHTYDAQLTIGTPQPLPTAAAFDGVDEFNLTCVATTTPWPHAPATLDFHATEGRTWRVHLSTAGARISTPDETPADVTITATASNLVLNFYDRIPLDTLSIEGDRRSLDQLVAWDRS
ncbi:maleylpyruvate isomerase family mycothiol-dependent enzyme [Winogradskya consettensis]|uniref:Maleylpyruvate isomerase family mycothiol-dependent enzyme n=1 Tax=Winogradskya consettensis TaxID=113560 RepID=A0A919SGV8_9ACTN|nr:maleylpyruvate isomerase family mycothiol-dependent enzyme [Actinoplanes consettensis]GIM71701.1 hypothetical protein Aco04nite_26590 [Actinoplanes consettensis]